jgi:ribosomal protein L11 methyltransferase
MVSVENSIKNAELNSLAFRDIWEGSITKTDKKYDVVVANIVADVLTFIAKDLKNALNENGVLILSGILDKYETKVLKFYKDCQIIKRIAQDEWVTLILKMKV